MDSLPSGYRALVIGASGAIGAALAHELERDPACAGVVRLSRPLIDLADPDTIARAAEGAGRYGPFALVINAAGVLHGPGFAPEKQLKDLDAAALAQVFAVNAIGPALLFKHFAPLLPAQGRCAMAMLSARVGSIGDNRLGGWYAYRASKAALNQIVRTAAIEIARKRPEAVVLALHPGTVATPLSAPFAAGRSTAAPEAAARALLDVIDRTEPAATGNFYAYDGQPIPW